MYNKNKGLSQSHRSDAYGRGVGGFVPKTRRKKKLKTIIRSVRAALAGWAVV